MSLDADQKKALRALARGKSKAELKALFALARSHSDRALLAAAFPAKKKAQAKKGDPLVREIEAMLRPILGPASEKGELLIQHVARKHKLALRETPKGVADAVRRLRKHVSDTQIRNGAKTLLSELAALYSTRESVV